MNTQETTYSFKEIDEARGVPKGTAFRAFKRLLGELREGIDFHYLNADRDAEAIAALRSSRRVYQTTVNAVLLSDSGHRMVTELLEKP